MTATIALAAAASTPAGAQLRAPDAVSVPCASVVIEKRGPGTVGLTVELAQTRRQRAQGLMGRRSLAPRHGML